MTDMIDTVLFDLDGTLLPFDQEEFTQVYLSKLQKVFLRLELDPRLAVKALWGGTGKMAGNDGTRLNSERFWEHFAGAMELSGERLRDVEDACNEFYSSDAFDSVKSVLKTDDLDRSRRLVHTLASRGYSVVLATNPLFPTCAVTTRLGWIGLNPQDFCLITDYSNSKFCKPNLGYYRDIFGKINKEPGQCLMVGNNACEDMIVCDLGAEAFLVTDFLENEANMDISVFRHGTLAEAERALYGAMRRIALN